MRVPLTRVLARTTDTGTTGHTCGLPDGRRGSGQAEALVDGGALKLLHRAPADPPRGLRFMLTQATAEGNRFGTRHSAALAGLSRPAWS
ncbi:MAG: hypothetical protein QMC79_09425 [Anaerosomatales bacterium]|nr:hypothetical protein [Anaerosomatales bacterium]